MTSLLAGEVRRVFARRLVRVTVALAIVGIAVGGVLAFVNTDSLSESAYRERVTAAKAEMESREQGAQACLQSHGVTLDRGGKTDVPQEVLEQCAPEFVSAKDPRFHRNDLKGILQGVTGVLAIVAWALGASLIGAEFASRSMTTLLTWESRRWRVFAAKAAVAITASAVLAISLLALTVVAMLPALVWHGAPVGTESSVATLAGVVLRGTAVAAIAAGMGFAIATVGRNTAAALGAGFAYILILENILGSTMERWRQWLLLGNVIVLVSGETNGGDVPGRTVTEAALFLTLVAVALLVGAGTSFRTRDLQ